MTVYYGKAEGVENVIISKVKIAKKKKKNRLSIFVQFTFKQKKKKKSRNRHLFSRTIDSIQVIRPKPAIFLVLENHDENFG